MKKRDGLTLIEILTVMGIVMLLAALLLPVYSMAKGAALRVDRTSRLKQLAAALEMYRTDHDGTVVVGGEAGKQWPDALETYTKSREIMRKPAYSGELRVPLTTGRGFVLNVCVAGKSTIQRSNPVTFLETAPLLLSAGNWLASAYVAYPDKYYIEHFAPTATPVGGKFLADHDRGGSLYAKWDGSVKWVKYSSTQPVDFRCDAPVGTESLFAISNRG